MSELSEKEKWMTIVFGSIAAICIIVAVVLTIQEWVTDYHENPDLFYAKYHFAAALIELFF